ncbi:MAG: putative bifunctional diguanylate cyclase/phosphodiesterase, partial [Sphingomicrobium sp.]
MYEAPDRYKRMISARLPDGESLGVASQEADEGSSPLRDAQLIARGQFAPFFAAVNSIAAVFMAMILYGHVPSAYLGGWALAVAATNVGAMQLARTQAVTHVGRSGRKVPKWQMIGDVALRALAWLSLPVISFSSLAPQAQAVAAMLIAGLGIASLGLVVVPACVTAWMAIFTAGLSYTLLVGRHDVPFDSILAILFTLGVAIVGVLTVARWAFGQLKTNADFGSQSESASLLLQEYEQRGVGWLWQVDGENRVSYISSRMSALLGRPAGQLLGHSLPALLGGHAELGRVLLEKQPFNSLEMELKTARGQRWISIAGDPIIDTAGRFGGFRGVGSDITEIRQTQERLTHLANMDVLSGLPNRGRVRQLLGEALRHATTSNVPCAIMFLDLDGFKPVNDTFGHSCGDQVLEQVGKRLRAMAGASEVAARVGGDEFLFLLPEVSSADAAARIATRLIHSLSRPYRVEDREVNISCSVGIALYPDNCSHTKLIARADAAMYSAKRSGGAAHCFYSPALDADAHETFELLGDLRQALARNEFELVYQPKIDAKTGLVTAAEALLRWKHPTRGVVQPSVFVTVAER